MTRIVQKYRLELYGAAVLILALFLFTVCYFSFYLSPYANQSQTELSGNWSYCTDTNSFARPMESSKAGDVAPGETMILTRALKEDTQSRVLMVKNYYQQMRVYIDDRMLLETPTPPAGQNPGAGLSFLPLTPQDKGKTLRLEITSPYTSYSGVPLPIFLGDVASLQAKIIAQAIPHIFFLFVCTVIGFFFLLFSTLNIYRGKKQWNSFFFGLFSVLLGLFCISRDDIIYLLFPPVTATDIAIGLHIVYLIPLMAYLYCYFTKYKKLVRIILALLCASAALFYALHLTGLCEFPSLVPFINWTLLVCFLPVAGIVLYELLHGNHIIRFLFPIIILVIVFSAGTIFLYYENQEVALTLYLAALFLLVITIWIYHLREFVRQRVQEKRQLQALQFRSELTQKSYEAMAAHMDEARMLRHEVGHHIAALQILNDQGEPGRIADYLAAISTKLNTKTVLYTENDLVNCIVFDRLNRAADASIRVTHDICVPPSLPMEDPDLCSLLTNLLDNAIEASEHLPERADRWINFQLRQKGNFMIVSCGNACSPPCTDHEGNFLSEKTGDHHGYGISIMRSIAQKYGSPLTICHNSGTFQVKMALQIGNSLEKASIET